MFVGRLVGRSWLAGSLVIGWLVTVGWLVVVCLVCWWLFVLFGWQFLVRLFVGWLVACLVGSCWLVGNSSLVGSGWLARKLDGSCWLVAVGA